MAGLKTHYGGFVVDAFDVLLITSDNVHQVITGSEASVDYTGELITINGGQGFYPLTKIDSAKNIEISISDSQFSMNGLAMTTGGTLAEGAKTVRKWGTAYTVPASTYQIVVPDAIAVAADVKIMGLTYNATATPTTGNFSVGIGALTSTITFNSEMEGKIVYPAYTITTSAADTAYLTVDDLDASVSGALYMNFPIYGDVDSANNGTIVADGYIYIPKVKITTSSKMGSSVKSASTFTLNATGLFNGRGNNVFELTYVNR
jgi:hypothetical protein